MFYANGYFEGGAARNIEVGFMPDKVYIVNVTNRNQVFEGPIAQIVHIDTGSVEIKPGYRVLGATNGWDGIVDRLVNQGGTWAGGNWEGDMFFRLGTLNQAAPTFTDNEVIRATEHVDTVPTTQHALIDTSTALFRTEIANDAAGGSNVFIRPYFGSAPGAAVGFSVGSAIGGNDTTMFWEAWAANPS